MQKGSRHNEEAKKKISEAKKGIKRGPCPEETRRKISEATTGVKKTITGPNSSWFPKGHRKLPEEERKRRRRERRRKYYHAHKVLKERKQIVRTYFERHSKTAQEWSQKVRERDGYKCQKCGTSENLHAHHIKPWKEYEELRFELSNGITYCGKCHFAIEPKKGRKGTRTGQKVSRETREKMSLAAKARIIRNRIKA